MGLLDEHTKTVINDEAKAIDYVFDTLQFGRAGKKKHPLHGGNVRISLKPSVKRRSRKGKKTRKSKK